MKCLKCGSKVDLSAERCAACGTPLDADGDGVPDVLDALVERKARAMVEAERAKLAAPGAPRPTPVVDDRCTKREKLTAYQNDLERNRHAKRPFWLMNSLGLWTILIVGFFFGGILMPACGEPMIFKRSLVAAPLLCPRVCQGCTGPGRIFTWHERSNSYEGNVSTQLCHTPAVNVDALTWMDVTGREDKDLQPFRLTLWSSVPFDFGLAVVALLLIAPFWFARLRKKALLSEQLRLEEKLRELERS